MIRKWCCWKEIIRFLYLPFAFPCRFDGKYHDYPSKGKIAYFCRCRQCSSQNWCKVLLNRFCFNSHSYIVSGDDVWLVCRLSTTSSPYYIYASFRLHEQWICEGTFELQSGNVRNQNKGLNCPLDKYIEKIMTINIQSNETHRHTRIVQCVECNTLLYQIHELYLLYYVTKNRIRHYVP